MDMTVRLNHTIVHSRDKDEAAWSTGSIRSGDGRERSTPMTAVVVCTGWIRTATSWRSSPARTAASGSGSR
jgi:hypothetical protein